MFTTPLNQRTVTARLKRIEICDLALACTTISHARRKEGQSSEKWDTLHDKLQTILNEFDEKQGGADR